MNRYEALGLSPEQIEKLTDIAAAYTAAGRPTSVDELVNYVFTPSWTALEKLAGISLPKQPWYRRARWWLLDALDALRRLLRQFWAGSAALTCPECYAGGGWERGACEGCRAKEFCQEAVLLP